MQVLQVLFNFRQKQLILFYKLQLKLVWCVSVHLYFKHYLRTRITVIN
jgi:hypothetical protein